MMTDEQRLHMITEQLLIVRDNLFRGMSKSMQKLQARSINEVLELPNFTESPQRKPLTDEEIMNIAKVSCIGISPHEDTLNFAKVIEAVHGIRPTDFKEKNNGS